MLQTLGTRWSCNSINGVALVFVSDADLSWVFDHWWLSWCVSGGCRQLGSSADRANALGAKGVWGTPAHVAMHMLLCRQPLLVLCGVAHNLTPYQQRLSA